MPSAEQPLSRARFALAIGVGLAVVVSAPFMGEVRRWIRLEFPGHFVAIVGGAVGAAALGALAWALARIRDRRVPRYGLIILAAVIAVAYARWSALGNPDSDAVERVHFIQFGLVAWLFYRAWLPLGDLTVLVLTFLSALTVGTFEEWFQWFIPARVGEVRDIALNSAAIVCGMLFSLAVQPPGRLAAPGRRGLAHTAMTTAIAVGALAGFVDAAHIGHEIRDDRIGAFRSLFTADELRALSVDRQARWASAPPLVRPARVSREDQYASEALLHVQARNTRWAAGEADPAWRENLILETYFASVLDAPSYVSATGHRWASGHRADAERRMRPAGGETADAEGFVSHAQGEFPILLWPRTWFRAVSAALVVGLIVAAVVTRRRAGPTR